MVKELTAEEAAELHDLEERFEERVSAYRAEAETRLEAGKEDALREELDRHRGYLELVRTGEVADVEANLRFRRAQAAVLEELLGV